MNEFIIIRKFDFEKERVWKILSDFSRSPGQGIEVVIVHDGAYKRKTGMIRTIKFGMAKPTERLIAQTEDSFKYEIIKGAPVRGFIGYVTVGENRGKTVVTWKGVFEPIIPGTGWVVKMISMQCVKKYLDAMEGSLRKSGSG